jgi:hypothetical protein
VWRIAEREFNEWCGGGGSSGPRSNTDSIRGGSQQYNSSKPVEVARIVVYDCPLQTIPSFAFALKASWQNFSDADEANHVKNDRSCPVGTL